LVSRIGTTCIYWWGEWSAFAYIYFDVWKWRVLRMMYKCWWLEFYYFDIVYMYQICFYWMYSHPYFVDMCLRCMYPWECGYLGWGTLAVGYLEGGVGSFFLSLFISKKWCRRLRCPDSVKLGLRCFIVCYVSWSWFWNYNFIV